MELRINGKTVVVPLAEGCSVDRLLEHLELDSKSMVVELNRRILTAAELPETALNERDVLELIQFVGGG